MADDGNRQIAIALSIGNEQFTALDERLGDMEAKLGDISDSMSGADTNVAAEVQSLKQEIAAGFSGLQQSLANLNDSLFTAITELSNNTGKWLAAIALAAANPADNTAEVQRQIDTAAASIKAVKDKLQTSIDSQKGD